MTATLPNLLAARAAEHERAAEADRRTHAVTIARALIGARTDVVLAPQFAALVPPNAPPPTAAAIDAAVQALGLNLEQIKALDYALQRLVQLSGSDFDIATLESRARDVAQEGEDERRRLRAAREQAEADEEAAASRFRQAQARAQYDLDTARNVYTHERERYEQQLRARGIVLAPKAGD